MEIQQTISYTTLVSQAISLVAVDVEGETVMLSIENGKYYGMDNVGSKIWNLLKDFRCVLDVTAVLVNEYEVEVQQCKADVLTFIQYLVREKLVKVHGI